MRKKHPVKLSANKIRFLEDLKRKNADESIITNFTNFVYKMQHIEESITTNKEIYEFNFPEFETFLKSLRCASQESLATHLNMIHSYRDFAKAEGLVGNEVDFIEAIKFGSLSQYLSKRKTSTRYTTRVELLDFIKFFPTIQDRLLYLLVFEGVNGTQYQDLINLKISDVDFGRKSISLPSKKIKISDSLLSLLSVCQKEELYNNGNTGYTDVPLVNSDYVLRPTQKYLNRPQVQDDIEDELYNGEQLNPTTIASRFYRLSRTTLDGDKKFCSISTIYNSGVIERAINELGDTCDKKDFVDYCINNESTSPSTGYRLYSIYEDFVKPKLS